MHLHVHASVRTLLCTSTHRHTLIVPGTGAGLSAQKGSDGRGYHFVFMPTHMFPAYPSYRWWAVIADRCVVTMTSCFRQMHDTRSSYGVYHAQGVPCEGSVQCPYQLVGIGSDRSFVTSSVSLFVLPVCTSSCASLIYIAVAHLVTQQLPFNYPLTNAVCNVCSCSIPWAHHL